MSEYLVKIREMGNLKNLITKGDTKVGPGIILLHSLAKECLSEDSNQKIAARYVYNETCRIMKIRGGDKFAECANKYGFPLEI